MDSFIYNFIFYFIFFKFFNEFIFCFFLFFVFCFFVNRKSIATLLVYDQYQQKLAEMKIFARNIRSLDDFKTHIQDYLNDQSTINVHYSCGRGGNMITVSNLEHLKIMKAQFKDWPVNVIIY